MGKHMFTAQNLVEFIKTRKIKIIGDVNRSFDGVGPIDDARPGSLSFCTKRGEEALTLLRNSAASVILCRDGLEPISFDDKTLVLVENPRLWFIRCVKNFFPQKRKKGIHPTAIIGENCQIGKNVYVGPNVSIDSGVVIGNDTEIHSGVQIYDDVQIGKNVTIYSGCILGYAGFGMEKNEEGSFEMFPQLGRLRIEDNVTIGANTCIARGSLPGSDTIIERGTKIQHLVQIAHNVIIGKHSHIGGIVSILGSAKIGEYCLIAPHSCVRDGVIVGKNSVVGMGAVVVKDVDENDVVAGVPARSIKHRKK